MLSKPDENPHVFGVEYILKAKIAFWVTGKNHVKFMFTLPAFILL